MDNKRLNRILTAFKMGADNKTACSFAKISEPTYYAYIKKNPEFLMEVDRMKDLIKHESVKRINKIIKKGDDKEAGENARWYLERKYRDEYGKESGMKVQIQNNQQTNYIEFQEAEVAE